MPTYSPIAILYITLNAISLLLVTILITSLLRSKPYFTRWTIFQISICAFVNHLCALPPILIYGDDLAAKAFDTPICLVAHQISQLFFYPQELFPLLLGFFLWYSVLKNNVEIENKCLRYVSGVIWSLSSVYQFVLWSMSSREPNWGLASNRLFCTSASVRSENWMIFFVPTIVLAVIVMFFTCHSIFILFTNWRLFKKLQSRRAAIRYGHAARLALSNIFFVTILLAYVVPKMQRRLGKIPEHQMTISEFAGSVVGTALFLVFGSTRSAVLFLPCCYYAPLEGGGGGGGEGAPTTTTMTTTTGSFHMASISPMHVNEESVNMGTGFMTITGPLDDFSDASGGASMSATSSDSMLKHV